MNSPQSASPTTSHVFLGENKAAVFSNLVTALAHVSRRAASRLGRHHFEFLLKFLERELLYWACFLHATLILPHFNIASCKSVIIRGMKKLPWQPSEAPSITVSTMHSLSKTGTLEYASNLAVCPLRFQLPVHPGAQLGHLQWDECGEQGWAQAGLQQQVHRRSLGIAFWQDQILCSWEGEMICGLKQREKKQTHQVW